MRSDTPAAAPQLLPDLVEALRGDLSRARYTVERTEQLLGEVAVAALHREDPLPARRALAGASDPAAILFSLFTLGAELPAARVAEVLPTLGTEGAQELGILAPAAGRATAGGAPSLLHATIDLSPYSAQDDHGHIDWWIASDRSELATGAALRPDHVLGVGGASLTLARITPRARVGRVLDLGCGSGIQALHATRHATHVIATDLSERALAFTAFNAALNRAQVEVRQGSLLDPVAGETFDLIVSNPPFVITPRTPGDDADRFTYRDGGRAGDSLLAELLEALPAHLAPGGTAVMLGNWERSGSQEWDQHPRRWLARAQAEGLDCWVIQRESEDPAQYAGTWARDGGITPRDPQWPCLIDGWLDDFESRNVRDIGFGYVLMRRPLPAAPTDAVAAEGSGPAPGAPAPAPAGGPAGTMRIEQATGTGSGSLGGHLAAGLRMMQRLRAMDDAQLARTRPRRAADLIERRHLVPGAWDPSLIELVQGAGLARTIPADQVLAATVGALDGTLTLGQTIGAVCALTGDDPDQVEKRLMPQLRELLLTGMLEL